MTHAEKCELLKDAITQLYSKEGRSFNYISSLLQIDRKVLTNKIKNEWRLNPAPPMRHATPSTQKFINRNRELIKSRLDQDVSITQIAKELGVERTFLSSTVIPADKILSEARDHYLQRIHENAEARRLSKMNRSSRNYDIEDIHGEEWRSILGYTKYYVSNMGRVKRKTDYHNTYYLIRPEENVLTGRVYVNLQEDGKRKNLSLPRVVAHAFVSGWSEEKNTVNHKDGDIHNNKAENLEWTSQGENNRHTYRSLHRNVVNKRRYQFKKIRYKDKYEFCTVAALAKFIGKSETQTRRMLDDPAKYDIQLIR